MRPIAIACLFVTSFAYLASTTAAEESLSPR